MSEIGTASVTPLREHAAEEIRALLARRKLSATELSRRMGVSQAYVWRRLSGETAFDLDDLEKIAMILDVDVTDILPAKREGRLITAAGNSRERDTSVKSHKHSVAKQSPVVGYPNRTIANLSTRRPGRILQTADA